MEQPSRVALPTLALAQLQDVQEPVPLRSTARALTEAQSQVAALESALAAGRLEQLTLLAKLAQVTAAAEAAGLNLDELLEEEATTLGSATEYSLETPTASRRDSDLTESQAQELLELNLQMASLRLRFTEQAELTAANAGAFQGASEQLAESDEALRWLEMGFAAAESKAMEKEDRQAGALYSCGDCSMSSSSRSSSHRSSAASIAVQTECDSWQALPAVLGAAQAAEAVEQPLRGSADATRSPPGGDAAANERQLGEEVTPMVEALPERTAEAEGAEDVALPATTVVEAAAIPPVQISRPRYWGFIPGAWAALRELLEDCKDTMLYFSVTSASAGPEPGTAS